MFLVFMCRDWIRHDRANKNTGRQYIRQQSYSPVFPRVKESTNQAKKDASNNNDDAASTGGE